MNSDMQLMVEAHILLHPTRYKIAELLSEKTMHLRELSVALGKEKRLVSYHLFILEEHGFVNGELKMHGASDAQEGRTKHYGVTEKGRFSYNLVILDKERIDDYKNDQLERPKVRREMVREYRETEKVDNLLSELKKSL